jgi:hypothetical protein
MDKKVLNWRQSNVEKNAVKKLTIQLNKYV